jgi:putative FmdB family regulatory protein
MPLYEYRCAQCDRVFEIIQKFSDEPLTVHEGCGGKVERLISAPGLQFKGSGWYITDYARAGANKGGPKANESKAETKSDSSTTKSDSSSTSSSSTTSSTKKD